MTFTYRGVEFDEFDHRYNTTALNERAVEIPIARHFIDNQPGTEGIEVGHVLGHYGPVSWPVVDRYEPAAGVANVDLFNIEGTYDWVVAVSTVEHVGNWPGEPADPARAVDAVEHLRSLSDRLLITVPIAQNPALDAAILDGALNATNSTTMLWSPDGWIERDGAHWGPARAPHIWPSALWIGEW